LRSSYSSTATSSQGFKPLVHRPDLLLCSSSRRRKSAVMPM
jgi:hypothetical protein